MDRIGKKIKCLIKENNLKIKKDLIKSMSTTAAQLLIPKCITAATAARAMA